MSDTLTRSAICALARERLGLPGAESKRLLDETLSVVREALEAGEEVRIARFGTFVLHRKAAREGRNPKTRERFVIAARRSAGFRASGVLRERVRRGGRPS